MKHIAWSYSSLSDFEGCPRRHYIMRVAKLVKEKEQEHLIWGNKVHKALELRIKDKTPLPEGMQQWEPIAAKFDKPGRVFAETKYTLTHDMQETSWFAKDAWYRAIIDVTVVGNKQAFLGDWKTGKPKDDHDQLKLFAATYMTLKPEVETVRTGYIWLQHNPNKPTTKTFHRDDVPVIWQEFVGRHQRLQEAHEKDKWVPKPSGLCRGWCPVGREHCEFWEPKRAK